MITDDVIQFNQFSDFDGESPGVFRCRNCTLTGHQELLVGTNLCKACNNLRFLVRINNAVSMLTLLGIVLIALGFFNLFQFVPSYVLYVVAALCFLPLLIVATPFKYKVHLYGLDKDKIVNVYLINYRLTGTFGYYIHALTLYKRKKGEYSEPFKKSILNTLIDFVLLADSPPSRIIIDWANANDVSPEEFTKTLLETNKNSIYKCLAPSEDFGLLSTFWENVSKLDEDIKVDFITQLANYADSLSNYTELEQKYFINELYVISETLIPEIEENSKWQSLLKILNEYEEPILPKSKFKAITALAMQSSRIRIVEKVEESVEAGEVMLSEADNFVEESVEAGEVMLSEADNFVEEDVTSKKE